MSTEFDMTVANFVWNNEIRLKGHLPPLVSKLTYFYRSSEVNWSNFEREMREMMKEQDITCNPSFLSDAFLLIMSR